MKCQVVFRDWVSSENSNRSVYSDEEFNYLSYGNLHSGTMFDVEITLPTIEENEIKQAYEDGALPVFIVLPPKKSICKGCGRPEAHKMCPAWGTPKYMTGKLFTKEDEVKYKLERDAAIEKLDTGAE